MHIYIFIDFKVMFSFLKKLKYSIRYFSFYFNMQVKNCSVHASNSSIISQLLFFHTQVKLSLQYFGDVYFCQILFKRLCRSMYPIISLKFCFLG